MKRSPIKRKTKRSKHARRPRDHFYMGWIKQQRCAIGMMLAPGVLFRFPCNGPIEADHAGRRGLGQKADDDSCIPLCRQHHGDRHDRRGIWDTMSMADQRTFLDATIQACREAFAACFPEHARG